MDGWASVTLDTVCVMVSMAAWADSSRGATAWPPRMLEGKALGELFVASGEGLRNLTMPILANGAPEPVAFQINQ